MALTHVEAYSRVVSCKFGNRLCQRVKTHGWGAANGQLGLISAAKIVTQSMDTPFSQDDGIRFFQNAQSQRRGDDALARPHHQLETKPAFHQLHIAGQGGLCQPQRTGRTGKGSGADDLMELQQMSGVNGMHALPYQILMTG